MPEQDKSAEPVETFGPTPGKYDVVDPNYRGVEPGKHRLRDPKKNRKTWPNDLMADGLDFDIFQT